MLKPNKKASTIAQPLLIDINFVFQFNLANSIINPNRN